MVSILSFIVVVLAASAFSAPIDIQPDSSTVLVKNPNERPFVKKEFNNEVTSVSTDRKERSSEEKDSDEMTTGVVTRPTRGFQSEESVEVTTAKTIRESRAFEGKNSDEVTPDVFTRPTRGSDEKDSDEVTTDVFTRPPRGFEMNEMTTETFTQSPRSINDFIFPSTTVQSKKRTVEDFLFTTLETSTEFDKHAIRVVESQEETESSSTIPSKKKKNIDEEPTSSAQSFATSTGLLQVEMTEKPNKRSEEPQFTSTMEMKLHSKKSLSIPPVEQEQLSQVQDQSNVEKTKSDN